MGMTPPPGSSLGFPRPSPLTPCPGGDCERNSVPTVQIKPRLLSQCESGCLEMGWQGSLSAQTPRGRRALGGTSRRRGWGEGVPSKLSGAEVEAMTQCIGSLMTQAWAGGQTDIFSVEKLLWDPPSGTSLPPTSCRGSLGTKPWGVGLCVCVCVCVCARAHACVRTPALLQRPPTQPGYTVLDT